MVRPWGDRRRSASLGECNTHCSGGDTDTFVHPSVAHVPIIHAHMWKNDAMGTGSFAYFPSVWTFTVYIPTGVVGLTLLWPPRGLHGRRSPVLTLGVCTCQAFVYFSFLEFPVSAF